MFRGPSRGRRPQTLVETIVMVTVHVQNGGNLAALLKAFPGATVHGLISEPGQDAWRVDLDPFDGLEVRKGVRKVEEPEEEVAAHFGPTRVLVKDEDDAVPSFLPADEAQKRGTVPEAILVRKDGWTLGFLNTDWAIQEAISTWNGQWALLVDLEDWTFHHTPDGELDLKTVMGFLSDTSTITEEEELDELEDCPWCGAVLRDPDICHVDGCGWRRRSAKKKAVKKKVPKK